MRHRRSGVQVRMGGGEMVDVVEDPDGVAFETIYTYALRDSLASVNQTRKALGVSDTAQNRSFVYDSLGRIVNHEQWAGAEKYPFVYQYLKGGQLSSVAYPSGHQLSYEYNNAGE